jgi:hypothetical protein
MAGQISSCTVLSSAVCRQPGSVVESLRGSTPATPVCRKVRQRGGCTVGAAVTDGGEEKAASKMVLFSFVTDNDSSRGAIQLPNTPAQDGNLGQMISSIEGKGRDYGSYVRAGEYRWFVRETGPVKSNKGTVIFLHGAPTQSYSYRVVLAQMAKAGYHCYAPDWLGFGFSEKPQPDYDFS